MEIDAFRWSTMTGMPLLANNMVTSVVRSNDHFQDSLSVPKANTNSKYKAVKYFPYSPSINNQGICFRYYYVLKVVYWLPEEKLNSYLQRSRLCVNHMTVLFFFVSSKRCSLVAYLDFYQTFYKFSKINIYSNVLEMIDGIVWGKTFSFAMLHYVSLFEIYISYTLMVGVSESFISDIYP